MVKIREYISVLPPPMPPVPVKVWKNETPIIKCPFCGTTFDVRPGTVKCPECGGSYMVFEWSWESFLIGLGVGLIVGFVISVAVYWFVIRPYTGALRLATTFAELLRIET